MVQRLFCQDLIQFDVGMVGWTRKNSPGHEQAFIGQDAQIRTYAISSGRIRRLATVDRTVLSRLRTDLDPLLPNHDKGHIPM